MDGVLVEIAPAGSDQDEEPEKTQPDTSHTQDASGDATEQGPQQASGYGPQQLVAVQVSPVRNREEYTYIDDQEDETTGSNQEGNVHEDGAENEGSRETSDQGLPARHASLKNTDKANPNTTTDNPKAAEPIRSEGSPTSPSITSGSHNINNHPAQDHHPKLDITPPDPPRTPASSTATVPSQPQTQGRPQNDPTSNRLSTALSLVDRAFLSGSGHEQKNRNEDTQAKSSPANKHPLRAPAPPAPPAALIKLVRPSPSPQVTPIFHQPQPPVAPTPASAPPPWWTSIPEIASMLAAQQRRPAPSGLSNDFTEFYASVLEGTDCLKRRRD
ncbi:hypothetical protein P171DRAFT_470636 [Karstenula rhodostoma CBS 690.94]|uniref:Uncharacterized protein n=1 Tax=Karstenula rhodostoma CBS 690.94 TaxID=1392251 RepID=A0A9P4PPR5_9PLEO|nr:hypothetical protein P171DRAFT_470636 [Karstenula rhodostoma CBS 690.94]